MVASSEVTVTSSVREKAEVTRRRSLAVRCLVSEVEATGVYTHASHSGPPPFP